jgi:sugar/nucleoside kinase (ribokinase family)
LHDGIVDLLRELKSSGLTISLDTNDDPDDTWGAPLAEILPLVDLFLPNEGELCRMAAGASLDEAMQIFGERVSTLVVKRGRLGCRVKHGDQIFDVAGLTVEPVDTIGAGDSFDAGFLAAYLRGKSLAVCARAGNMTGALSTLAPGGTEAFRNAALRAAFLAEHGYDKL